MIGYNKYMYAYLQTHCIKLLPYNAPIPINAIIPLYDKKYALHKSKRPEPDRAMALYGPSTYCGAGQIFPAYYFQMRRSTMFVCEVTRLLQANKYSAIETEAR